MGRPLKISKSQAILTLTSTNGTTEVVTVSQTLADEGVIAGMPFVVATTTGGLTAGTTYYILSITGASTFTVSDTPLNANPTSTPVNLTTAGPVSVAVTVGGVDTGFNNPEGSSNTYSVVGGNTAQYGKQVSCNVAIGISGEGTITCLTGSANLDGVGTDFVNTFSDGTVVTTTDGTLLGVITDIANANSTFATFDANAAANATDAAYVYATEETGYIVRQKGKQKYLVKGLTSGLVGPCYTANLAVLTPNTMSITATFANAATAPVQSLSDHTTELFTATSGPVATGDIVLQNATPAFASFNSAATANASNGQPYPIVTISNA